MSGITQALLASIGIPKVSFTASVIASSYNQSVTTTYTVPQGSFAYRYTNVSRFDAETATTAPSGWVQQSTPLIASNGTAGTLSDYGASTQYTTAPLASALNTTIAYTTTTATLRTLTVNTNYPMNALLRITPNRSVTSTSQSSHAYAGLKTGGASSINVNWAGGNGYLLVFVRADTASTTASVTSSSVTLGSKLQVDGGNNINARFAYFVNLSDYSAGTITLSYNFSHAFLVQALVYSVQV